MQKFFVFMMMYCASVQSLEVPLKELASERIQTYYLDGWIPIAVFLKNDDEKARYQQSLFEKYIPFTEYSRFFGNSMASSLYYQQRLEQLDASNMAKEYGVFIKLQPTVGCSFLSPPKNQVARLKDDCTGVEYDGNGKSLDDKVVTYLATPIFSIKNDRLVIDISPSDLAPIIDFTPPRMISRRFVSGMTRVENAFKWHRFDVVIEEMETDKALIKDSKFSALISHILLREGTEEQLHIVSRAERYGFDLDARTYDYGSTHLSAAELGIASGRPKTLTYLSKRTEAKNTCIARDRMQVIKQVSDNNVPSDDKKFEEQLSGYFNVHQNEYCWKILTK